MSEQTAGASGKNVAVLGAGIVGVSCALHLQARGFNVTLIDRKPPGSETSYGNAGIISKAFIPSNTPKIWRRLPKFLLNRDAAVQYALGHLAGNKRWLYQYLKCATAKSLRQRTLALGALTATSIEDHRALMADAGVAHRLRDTGWLNLYRDDGRLDNHELEHSIYRELGADYDELGPEDIPALEPHLKPIFKRATWIKSASSVDSPGKVTTAYGQLFMERGGRLMLASAKVLTPEEDGYSLRIESSLGEKSSLAIDAVVVALGAWSMDLLKPLGYRFPLSVERGYHCHFGALGNATLSRPCYDSDASYIMTPMEQGIRVSSGVELKHRDAPPTPNQLRQVLPLARQAFPLAETRDEEPWLGRRPAFPDGIPVIGEAPNHKGLWLAFGHGHFGFGTGAASGRAIATLMAGESFERDLSGLSPKRLM